MSSINLTEEEIKHYLINTENVKNGITSQSVFNNDYPLHLEIGCGNGHFLFARSQIHPMINYLGIEISKKRILKSIYKINKQSIENIRFIHGDGRYILDFYLPNNSLDACYLNFPDPWPKRKHIKHRILNPSFIDILHNKLRDNGSFYFVSDDDFYFFKTLSLFESDTRFMNGFISKYRNNIEEYETSLYEEKWRKMGKEIYYMLFRKNKLSN